MVLKIDLVPNFASFGTRSEFVKIFGSSFLDPFPDFLLELLLSHPH